MAQQPIELILARQLAGYLTVPTVLVDPAGTLLYYNEPTEHLLGVRYDETGELSFREWTGHLVPVDESGEPVERLPEPLVEAVAEGHAGHAAVRFRTAEGALALIQITAIPLDGQSGSRLGSLALLWETHE
jgi:hypothetical protein